MKIRTLKLPQDLDRRLDEYAQDRGVSRSFLVREAVSSYLNQQPVEPRSALSLAGDLAGSLAGPGDLSTNPAHLEGLGEGRPAGPRATSARRGRRPARRPASARRSR